MKIRLNNTSIEVEANISLREVIDRKYSNGIPPTAIVIYNDKIVSVDDLSNFQIKEMDKIKIYEFVGGG